MSRWAVLLTTHERRETTLACLDALIGQTEPGVELSVFLCDAGSTDGTAAAVRRRLPDAEVLERGPELFWNSGMRVAWARARDRGGVDAYLWLNDDTRLDPDAVARLRATLEESRRDPAGPAIVVGATRDPDTGEVTYSGVRRPDRWRPVHFARVEPTDRPQPVETMNGNCVVVPAAVAERVGNLDPAFAHSMGDFDYGLRAGRLGVPVLLAPGTVGTCGRNAAPGERSVAEEWRAQTGVKGLPPGQWSRFVRRWGGHLWPIYVVSPYARRLAARLWRNVAA